MTDTYKVKVKCTNCEFANSHAEKLEIEKGLAVYQVDCPECKTKNLIKKEN